MKNIQKINIEDLRTYLHEYYKFNLITITEIVMLHVKSEYKRELQELILKYNDNMSNDIEELLKDYNNFKMVDSELIDNIYNRIHIGFWEVRNYFMKI